jgi:SET and MYND domain-containing protein
MMDGPQISVRTLKPIKKEEEVYISYIDTSNPYHRRQRELKARWFFECRCPKCQKGATLGEDQWALDVNNLPRKAQDIADALLTHGTSTQDPASYVGESQDEKRTGVIQSRAFAEYESVQKLQNPEDIVMAIENVMRLCHQSGLWPLHRQPYAALRDDLIVNLLSVGKFPIAWAHCAARYKHILPKLYPVHFHPVRVVQTWQTAMLAAYLASTPEGIGAPEVNMGLIAMMLVKQVLDAAILSHGMGNAFTKSVRKKAEEMMAEVKRSFGGTPNNEIMNKELVVQRDLLSEMGEWVKG